MQKHILTDYVKKGLNKFWYDDGMVKGGGSRTRRKNTTFFLIEIFPPYLCSENTDFFCIGKKKRILGNVKCSAELNF